MDTPLPAPGTGVRLTCGQAAITKIPAFAPIEVCMVQIDDGWVYMDSSSF